MNSPEPPLLHRLKAQASILTLVVAESRIFAGTQDGEIIVWSLDTYQHIARIRAHKQSVLCLSLSGNGRLLFSSAGDAILNVWDASNLQRVYSIYSSYDVGDVFCVAYSSNLQTVYLGAQNTAIQWYDLSERDSRPPPDPKSHPSYRNHRFFDSKGPGGTSTPRPSSPEEPRALGGRELEIERNHIVHYAHFGYVYCMLLAQDLKTPRYQGEVLISGGGDGSIKLWALDASKDGTIQPLECLENGDASVLALAICSNFLYSGKLEGDIDVWDLETCQRLRHIKACSDDILTLSVGHDLIFSGSSKGGVKIFNQHHTKVSEWQGHERLILTSAVTSLRNRELYVSGGNDGIIAIWDVSNCFDRPKKADIADNEELINDLAKLISYPTISSRVPYANECRRGARFLRDVFKRFGAETDLLSTEEQRNPIVFARFSHDQTNVGKRKAILFYGHYDVVSADSDTHGWSSDPFALRKADGYLYGRGASDNKGPVLAAVYAVADVIRAKSLNIDIVFLIEGEEESGSFGFAKAIRKHKSLIGKINWILLANSYWLTDDIPCLTYGLRGVVRAILTIRSDRENLHSGVDGSYILDEAMKDLVAVLAGLTDHDGKVNIPGFYDDIPPIRKEEDELYRFIIKNLLQRNAGLGDPDSMKEMFKARWREPSLTVHRVQQSGPASSTIIPHTARADISIRLVPNQTTKDVIDALSKYLDKSFTTLKTSNKMSLEIEHAAEPWLGDPSNHIFKVLEKAVMEVWKPLLSDQERTKTPLRSKTSKSDPSRALVHRGSKSPPLTSTILSGSTKPSSLTGKPDIKSFECRHRGPPPANQRPLYIREGGSIPAIRFLEQEFNASAAHLPCGQTSDSAHLDNERLRVTNLFNSREIFRRVFIELGKS
ncbi:uncharacterized protein KY384_002614 [Bacidia gigantensis]|uniref:uncharacterized protein n=1 Tax=Bacidia gigantensis TaxID=2732470 RepID=UPI001D049D87|nr:uncharacterized protein KY384_002614 [Bacidia gigantensis]KAG8532737.1 hypothetical protein KY384_002614 [Bacidia gigantensis]